MRMIFQAATTMTMTVARARASPKENPSGHGDGHHGGKPAATKRKRKRRGKDKRTRPSRLRGLENRDGQQIVALKAKVTRLEKELEAGHIAEMS